MNCRSMETLFAANSVNIINTTTQKKRDVFLRGPLAVAEKQRCNTFLEPITIRQHKSYDQKLR